MMRTWNGTGGISSISEDTTTSDREQVGNYEMKSTNPRYETEEFKDVKRSWEKLIGPNTAKGVALRYGAR